MITKNQIKSISQLKQKKYRNLYNQFVVEGRKGVQELLQSNFKLVHIVALNADEFSAYKDKLLIAKQNDLSKMSALTTPPDCLAVFEIPKQQPVNPECIILALDDIRDPGNLGTIIRLCDWFGIEHLLCSEGTVDAYNPKVIQATMGSITRVNIVYDALPRFLEKYPHEIYGTFMKGDIVYNTTFPKNACIIMGNEANGISKEVESYIQHRITIPRFGSHQKTESLNVATATAILLNECKRSEYL